MEATAKEQPSLLQRFLTASFWSLVGTVSLRGFTILSYILVARILGDTDFGKFGAIQVTLQLTMAFATLGLNVAITKLIADFRSKNPKKTFELITTSLLVVSGLSFSLGLLVFVSADLLSRFLDAGDVAIPLRIMSLATASFSINLMLSSIFNGYEKFNINATVSVAKGFLIVVLIIPGAMIFGLAGAVTSAAIAEVMTTLFYAMQLKKLQYSFKENFRSCSPVLLRENLRLLLNMGIPLFWGGFIMTPTLWFTRILLAHQSDGFSALGIFNAAEKWYQLVLFIPSTTSLFILPLMSNLRQSNDAKGYYRVFFANITIDTSVISIVSVLMAGFGKNLMGVFGTEFTGAAATLNLLLIAALATALNTDLGQYLVSKNLVRQRMLYDFLLALLLLVTAFLLVPRLYDRGLAMSYTISYLITVILMSVFVIILTRKDIKNSVC